MTDRDTATSISLKITRQHSHLKWKSSEDYKNLFDQKFRTRSIGLMGWLVDSGYKEDFVREQIACSSNL